MAHERILVVEDETIVAMDIAATLRRLGYQVVGTADNATAAVEAAAALQPDLVLMDIRIKGPMDGIEAAAAIQQQRATPVVFLTAHADPDTVERAKVAMPFGYLVKPFDERTMHRVLDLALHRARTEKAASEQALDALWKSEERFRLLVDAVKGYAIVMLDLEGRVASWNSGAERLTGYSAEEAIGQLASMFRLPEEAFQLPGQLARVRETGGDEWENIRVRKDGKEYLAHVYCAPMYDRMGMLIGYVTVTNDVTEQRRMEAQIAQAQRLESLGRLAGGIAHDFNNMLMVIFTRCDILQRVVDGEKSRQQIAQIRAAATRNRDLTQQLLAASRQQVLQLQVVNINEIVKAAFQLLGLTLGEHIHIELELYEPLWNVAADPGKIHQVIMNLVINARDAMPEGGSLFVETRNVKVDSSYARQHIGLREGHYVSLVVTDTGQGIPEAIRDQIYDPFFTTKGIGQGTGLGLAVVRGIVEQSGGLIWVYSEEGRGTTFKIFLPRNVDGTRVEMVVEEEASAPRGTETILLVEDEHLLRSVVRESLEEHGYRVIEAATPAQALAANESHAGAIDLLLSDVIMPGMTGRELAERISAIRPSLRAIFMSGYTNHALVSDHTLPRRARYLEKPIPTTAMLRIVREVLDDEVSWPRSLTL